MEKQNCRIDAIVVYLDFCHRQVRTVVKVPAEGYFDFLRGFDPITYRRLSELEKDVDTTNIDFDSWEQAAEKWKTGWVTFLRRVYARMAPSVPSTTC